MDNGVMLDRSNRLPCTGAFLAVLASGIQIETTTTTVEQSTADGGDAVYQSGENAQFFAGGEE